ncbi:MAG: ATP-binding cassette domain-containing protein, partial [Acidimicrobiia bacterium]
QERRLMGASEEVAKTEEKPPSWTESWRIAKSVRSLRRIWYALPFVVGSGMAARQIMSVFYDEVFGLGPTARGLIGAFDEPVEIIGLLIGATISNRLLRYRPGRVITYVGLVAVLQAASFALISMAPFWPVAVALSYARGFIGAILGPALLALISMTIPPRIRGFALSTFAVFAIPGLAAGPLFGFISDTFGLRLGLLVMAPVFLIGALIITTAGASAEADIRAATAASMASHISRESKKQGKAKLLVVKDLDVHYDSVQVLFNVDFEVEEGEIVALLGTNGAGKSTLLRAIAGTTPPSNGAIFFDGEDITQLPPSAHAARGIVSVPGGKGVFPSLTVAEHLRIAAWMHRTDPEYVRTASERVLEFFPPLKARMSEPALNLSGGEQQMLVLGQAFLSRPRFLMIDELSLGLAPAVISQLLDVVRAIHGLGTTVILVEQSVNVALTLAERAVFMEKGEIRFTGPTDDLLRRPDILRSVYLRGTSSAVGSLTGGRPARQATPTDEPVPAIEVRGVTKTFGGVTALSDVSFELEEGKILGLIGPNGAGKTTLFDIIAGFVPPDEGEVLLFGEDITDLSPDQRARLGLVRSFQDAKLFPSLT